MAINNSDSVRQSRGGISVTLTEVTQGMEEELFRTVVEPELLDNPITYPDRILLMGSCFTEQIGERLERLKFNTQLNPFGILFNPESMANSLERIVEGTAYTADDLEQVHGRWVSFDHHGRYGGATADEALDGMNEDLIAANEQLPQTRFLILTFGSAWAYRHLEQDRVVANCHKVPNTAFRKELLSLEELTNRYELLFKKLIKQNPDLQIICTVSPVRHWKDGVINNQRSKSVLHLLIAALEANIEQVHYFPAYEIVMDDLRDYRFYDRDLLHPNTQAVDYIWNKFVASCMHADCAPAMAEVKKIRFALDHRTDDPESVSYQRFVARNLKMIASIKERFPFIDLAEEEKQFLRFKL